MAGHRMGSDSTRLNHRYLRYCPAQASTSRGSASLQPSSWDPAGGRGSLYRLTQICGNQMVSAHHTVRAPVHCTRLTVTLNCICTSAASEADTVVLYDGRDQR